MTTTTRYAITPIPQPPLSTCRAWDVTGGTEPYVVRCDSAGVWTCSCPVMTKARAGVRDLARRNGCKHVHAVACGIGDHKFLPAIADGGAECVRCHMSVAQHEYETYGPADEPMRPSRHDY